jgi:hypothetical protein
LPVGKLLITLASNNFAKSFQQLSNTQLRLPQHFIHRLRLNTDGLGLIQSPVSVHFSL